MNSPNCLISISIEYQLKTLVQTDNIRTSLFQNLNAIQQNHKNDGNIRDVYDSELYRRILSESQKQGPRTFTFQISYSRRNMEGKERAETFLDEYVPEIFC